MDNRHFGYWHIGQVYNKMAKFAGTRVPTDDMQLTQGQLLQVNFAPVWHGRMIGEVQNIIKTICMDRNGAESPDDFDRRRYQRLETEVLWLTEMRSHSVVFCDLALNVLHNRLYLIHLTEFIFILTLVLSRRELNGADGPLSDYVEQRGGHAAPFVASASMVLPVENSGVKRFKKAGTEQQANSAVVHEQASSVAPSVQTEGAPPADTLVSGWDFEKDLEQIFAAETISAADPDPSTNAYKQPSTNAYKQRRGTYFYYNCAAIGLACAQATAMRIDIALHTRPRKKHTHHRITSPTPHFHIPPHAHLHD